MKNQADILRQFPKAAFWDVELSKLDIAADKDLIIPRALYLTTDQTFEEDIEKLEQLYTGQQILETLKKTRVRVSNHVCAMVARHFNTQPFSRFAI